MKSKFVKTMLFAFLTIGLAVSCAPKGSGGNPGGGGGEGGDSGEGGGQGGDDKLTTFPADEVKAFFAAANIDIGNLPSYALGNENGYFDIDDSDPEYFDIYPTNTTSAELVAYKNALKTAGWAVISPDEDEADDFILQYGETDAYVSLLDYTSFVGEGEDPYNLISFYVYSYEGNPYYADQVADDFNANLAAEGYDLAAEWDSDYNEFYLGYRFGASTDESEANLKTAAYTLASFLPEYMALYYEVYGDPEAEGYIDIYNDNSYYYAMIFVSPDSQVSAQVISYVYNNYLVGTISITGPLAPLPTVNEFIAAYLAEAELVAEIPDLSEFEELLDEETVQSDLSYALIWYEGDFVGDLADFFLKAGWTEFASSQGRAFADPTKAVSITVVSYYGYYTGLLVAAYVEPEPLDWGEYESLNGLLAAFLEVKELDHNAQDVSALEALVVDWYEDFDGEDGNPNFNLWFLGDVVDSLLTTLKEDFGYSVSEEPNRSDAYECVSKDGLLTIWVGYSPTWGTFLYVYASADLVVEPLNDQIAAYLASAGVDTKMPDFSSFDDSVLSASVGYSSFVIYLANDVVEAVGALFGEGWTKTVDSYGDDLYISDDGCVKVNVYYSSYSEATVVSIAAEIPMSVNERIAAFLEANNLETEIPDFSDFDDLLEEVYTSSGLSLYFGGDITEEVSALFAEGWEHTSDDTYDYYTSADGLVVVKIYYSSYWEQTNVAFSAVVQAEPIDDQLAAFFAALDMDPEFPSFAAYDEYFDSENSASYPAMVSLD